MIEHLIQRLRVRAGFGRDGETTTLTHSELVALVDKLDELFRKVDMNRIEIRARDQGIWPAGKVSVPEPPPLNEGDEVTPKAVEWLRRTGRDRLVPVIEARAAFGLAKYGQPLRTGNGRDTVEDLRQEIADAIQYAVKGRMLGLDLYAMRDLVIALHELVTGGM